MAAAIPSILEEQRACRRRDPVAYDAVESLYDAYEQLVDALDELRTVTSMSFDALHEPEFRPLFREKASPERLAAAREQIEVAERGWAAAVRRADDLLCERGA